MSVPTAELRDLVCQALAEGATVEEVEYDVLDPAQLPGDEHDALWLYALARAESPRPPAVTIIGN